MGVNRDLKKANESYWGGKISQKELLAEGKRLRGEHWKIQKEAGIDIIPSNDFSHYDHVLDHIQLFGVSWPHICTACKKGKSEADQSCRPYPKDTPSTTWIPLTSSSLWVEVFRSLKHPKLQQLMFPPWCVKCRYENNS